MKLSAVIIAKDEEEIVENALKSVKDFDEIIFVDTGSTDQTIEIAKKYTDKIFHFEWCDDFSAARNFAIEKATGDWIYSIDCDHELISDVEKVRDEAKISEELGHKTVFVKTFSGTNDHHVAWREVFFKNDPEVKWIGAVHENLTPRATYKTALERRCGYSKNHFKDPLRNVRILENNPITTRSKFYLGRENYERRNYDEAIKWMREYLKEGKWTPEIGEAYLVVARCYWYSNRGDLAREACLNAIKTNPDFKEALVLMAEMHYEPYKHKWLRLASVAESEDVLFKRL